MSHGTNKEHCDGVFLHIHLIVFIVLHSGWVIFVVAYNEVKIVKYESTQTTQCHLSFPSSVSQCKIFISSPIHPTHPDIQL